MYNNAIPLVSTDHVHEVDLQNINDAIAHKSVST